MNPFELVKFLRYILAYPGFAGDTSSVAVINTADAPKPATPQPAAFTREQSEDAITECLNDPRFTWRSIGALASAAHMSEDDTRDMLEDMGIRRNTEDKEVYTNKL